MAGRHGATATLTATSLPTLTKLPLDAGERTQLATADFTEHPEIADGASETDNSLFARDQSHARSVSEAYSTARELNEISQC
jgi:hypothetical protein